MAASIWDPNGVNEEVLIIDGTMYLAPYTGAVSRTLIGKLADQISVLSFGVVADGVTDAWAGITAAWAVAKTRGGDLLIPPGSYYLSQQLVLDLDTATPRMYNIYAYGATFIAGPAVTTHAVKIYRSVNYFGLRLAGLTFDHRSNATVQGAVEIQGSSNFQLIDCNVEISRNKGGYAAVQVGPYTPGNDATNAFWGSIDHLTVRSRQGADLLTANITSGTIVGTVLTVNTMGIGALAVGSVIIGAGVTTNSFITSFGTGSGGVGTYNLAVSSAVGPIAMTGYTYTTYAIKLRGTCNALTISNCVIGSVKYGVYIDTDGVGVSLANTLMADNNRFEGCQFAYTIDASAPVAYMPTGLVITRTRCEVLYAFLTILGSALLEPSCPPKLSNNYLTNGSVEVYLTNPNNQIVYSLDSSYSGALGRLYQGGIFGTTWIAEGTGNNFNIQNFSGTSTYASSHLVMGGYHFWYNPTVQQFFQKPGVPASASDGKMAGVISGTDAFAAAATKVVTIGVTMPAATYKVSLACNGNRTVWVTGKTTTQFTLNAAAANSDSVDWMVHI